MKTQFCMETPIGTLQVTTQCHQVCGISVYEGKYAWIIKIGEKGQFVIPKEARDLFDFQPGEEILVLGDKEKGLAVLPKEKQKEIMKQIFVEFNE